MNVALTDINIPTSLEIITNNGPDATLGTADDFDELVYTNEDGATNIISQPIVAEKLVFSAEYAGAVLQADGTDNAVVINASNTGLPAFMNYYEASNFNIGDGSTTNDYNVVLRITLPSDFESWSTVTDAIVIDFDGTTDASLDADIYEEGDMTPIKDNMPVFGSAGDITFLGTFTESILAVDTELTNLVAGDTFVIVIQLTVADAAAQGDSVIRIGDITLNYNRRRF